MKIKLLKDIASVMGGKKGDILTFNDRPEEFFDVVKTVLLNNGWAEEVKDEIDMDEIRKLSYIGKTVEVQDEFSKEELYFIYSYRIVKAVIDKLNREYEGDEVKMDIEYWEENGFEIQRYKKTGTVSLLPMMNSTLIAKKVIELCGPELKILFNIKD